MRDDKGLLAAAGRIGPGLALVRHGTGPAAREMIIALDVEQALGVLQAAAPEAAVAPWVGWWRPGDHAGGEAAPAGNGPVLLVAAPCRELTAGAETEGAEVEMHPWMSQFIESIAAAIRRVCKGSWEPTLVRGDVELNVTTQRVTRAGIPVQLSRTSLRLLHILMDEPERVYSREQLLRLLGGGRIHAAERTIDVQIRRLRKALGAHGGRDVIRTVHGTGYAYRIAAADDQH